MRASDADRDFVAERLRNAAAEGRILPEELEHRLEAALSARTYGELNAVVADLPPDPGMAPRRLPKRLRPATVVALLILFPLALAVATAVFVAFVALLTAWALAVSLAALFLGPRVRALRAGPWAVGYRAYRGSVGHRASIGCCRGKRSSTPWL
jgi:hypothetical protein